MIFPLCTFRRSGLVRHVGKFTRCANKVRWSSGGSANSDRDNNQDLRQHLSRNPSQGCDTRSNEISDPFPDFIRHRASGKAFWLESQKKPGLVESQLGVLGPQLQRGRLKPGSDKDDVQIVCDQVHLEEAVEGLMHMDQQGTVPSVDLYRSLLKACAQRKALALARRVHAHLAKHGLESTKGLGEYAVKTLVKCGDLQEAVKVFSRLPDRTAFSWTAVISGFAKAGKGVEALGLYKQMQSEGVQPNKHTFVSLVEASSLLGDLEHGIRMHAEACKYGCASDLAVGTCLIDMYTKCGSIVEARAVFDGLPERDVVSWTVMLNAYVGQDQADTALDLYLRLQQDGGVCPDGRTFVAVLQACGSLACKEENVLMDATPLKPHMLQIGKLLHVEARRSGYDSNLFVANALITMYGKCGSIVDAANVFHCLPLPSLVSWNAIIACCAQQGEAEMALTLYGQMSEQGGVSPDALTCASVLQACSSLADECDAVLLGHQALKLDALPKGKACHADAVVRGYQSNLFVCSALVSMYARCGSLTDAQQVFDRSMHRDVVSWNAMLAAFTQQGEGEQALQLYSEMQEVGCSVDARTFVTAAQACGILADQEKEVLLHDGQTLRLEALQKGRAIHSELVRMSRNDFNVFVGNALVSMYGKCGSIKDARTVFDDTLFPKDIVSWNAILTACVQQDQVEMAVELYCELQKTGDCAIDSRIFVTLLQACCRFAENEGALLVDEHLLKVATLQKGKALHAEVQRLGYDAQVSVCNTLISTYGKCGCVEAARDVFQQMMPQLDVGSCNAMLAAYFQGQRPVDALQLYEQMLVADGVSPDVWTFLTLLQACRFHAEQEEAGEQKMQDASSCVKFESLQKGKAIQAEAWKMGLSSDGRLVSALVSVYGTVCGSVDEAEMLFFNSVSSKQQQDVVLWNAMLSVYVEHEQLQKALQLYHQMQEECVSPSEATYICILQAFSSIGALDVCVQIHRDLVASSRQGHHLSLLVGNILLDAHGKSGCMNDALDVFHALPCPDLISWNALIAGFARQGNWEESLQTFHKMQVAGGVKPDGVTFLTLLTACSHAGMVDAGVDWFQLMSTAEYGMTPQIQHYATMVDLLGRAGHFAVVVDLLAQMPVEPDVSMWRCLLGACQKHGNLALGKLAFDRAVSLDPTHAAAYTLMSNIYKHAGMWDEATEVHELRQQAGAWKQPGQTWIQHDKHIHSFVVGNLNNEQKRQVQNLLQNLEMRQGKEQNLLD